MSARRQVDSRRDCTAQSVSSLGAVRGRVSASSSPSPGRAALVGRAVGAGRVWEEARRLPLREAILRAMPETSRAITTAGIVLAVSFGMLGSIPLAAFRELAFAMAVGILLDTFVARSVLMPALIALVGRVSAWPGRLAQEPAATN